MWKHGYFFSVYVLQICEVCPRCFWSFDFHGLTNTWEMADRLVQQIWYSGTSKIRSASKFHLEIIFIIIFESVPLVQWLWLCFDDQNWHGSSSCRLFLKYFDQNTYDWYDRTGPMEAFNNYHHQCAPRETSIPIWRIFLRVCWPELCNIYYFVKWWKLLWLCRGFLGINKHCVFQHN